MLQEYEKIHIQKIMELKEIQKSHRKLLDEFELSKRRYEEFEIFPEPSVLAKMFHTKSYKRYQESLAKHKLLKDEYEQLKISTEQLETNEEIEEKINILERSLSEGRNDFKIVINYFIENNLPIILTQQDKDHFIKKIKESNNKDNWYTEKRKIERIEDVMLVHKTNYSPQNDTIDSRMTSNVTDSIEVEIAGEKHNINLRPRRNSVHFSVNHEVSPNNGGNWNDMKYVVIVPLLGVPKEQFGSNNCVDTFTEGAVKLNEKSYIICPKDEIEIVKKNNPNATVIGYEGENVQNYANALLWALGYPVEQGNDWGFENTLHQNEYTQMMQKEGYSSFIHHTHTKTKQIETKRFYVSMIIGVIELIMNNSKFNNIDSKTIVEQTQISKYLYYCDDDTRDLFNYYLQEIGLEPNYLNQGNSDEDALKYCISLIDIAKKMTHTNPKTL